MKEDAKRSAEKSAYSAGISTGLKDALNKKNVPVKCSKSAKKALIKRKQMALEKYGYDDE